MGNAKKRELALGLVMLGAGLLYLLFTYQLPRRGAIDSAFVPYVLGFAMCALGAMQVVAARRLAGAAAGNGGDETAAGRIDQATVLRTVGLIVAYVALIDLLGFPVATALYLYVQFLVLNPAGHRPPHWLYATIAIISAAVIHVTFRYGFDLMLPAGLLD